MSAALISCWFAGTGTVSVRRGGAVHRSSAAAAEHRQKPLSHTSAGGEALPGTRRAGGRERGRARAGPLTHRVDVGAEEQVAADGLVDHLAESRLVDREVLRVPRSNLLLAQVHHADTDVGTLGSDDRHGRPADVAGALEETRGRRETRVRSRNHKRARASTVPRGWTFAHYPLPRIDRAPMGHCSARNGRHACIRGASVGGPVPATAWRPTQVRRLTDSVGRPRTD